MEKEKYFELQPIHGVVVDLPEKKLLLFEKERNSLRRSKIFFHFSWINLKNKKIQYFLALLSCAIVVTATGVANSVINQTPLIFLKMAESIKGQKDITLTSKGIMIYEQKSYEN